MAKARPQADVVVLGSHPCCYLAAALLKEGQVEVVHATIPEQNACDRLVLVSPKFFELHKLTAALKKMPQLAPVHGLRFLADDGTTQSEYLAKTIVGFVAGYQQIRAAMIEQAKRAKVELIESKTFDIHGADEHGVQISINGVSMRPRMLIAGGELSPAHRKILGLPTDWDGGVVQRYTFVRLKGAKYLEASSKNIMPMSLDLHGKLYWAWMLAGVDQVQVAVAQPIDSCGQTSPAELLTRWIDVLVKHGVLKPAARAIDTAAAESIHLPLGGALAQEGVANRTLLIGPAGGFFTACAEDIYPNCWSAIFAAEVAKKALGERHLQDALGAYRQTWGSTLGDYLRGPQENLRFLLPLVYRNPVMTARMAEAILAGESVVR